MTFNIHHSVHSSTVHSPTVILEPASHSPSVPHHVALLSHRFLPSPVHSCPPKPHFVTWAFSHLSSNCFASSTSSITTCQISVHYQSIHFLIIPIHFVVLCSRLFQLLFVIFTCYYHVFSLINNIYDVLRIWKLCRSVLWYMTLDMLEINVSTLGRIVAIYI